MNNINHLLDLNNEAPPPINNDKKQHYDAIQSINAQDIDHIFDDNVDNNQREDCQIITADENKNQTTSGTFLSF